jgi:MFS family permease
MDKIFEVVGLEGSYQTTLLIINWLTGVLPCVYSLQIPFLTKHPSFFVKKLKSENPNKIYEMDFSDELCNSSLYQITKNPKKSINNWSYTFDLYCERESYNTIMTSIIFVGGMIGTLFILPLPDKYGRAKILKLVTLISLILHFNLLFSSGPIHLILINFIGGIFSQIFALGYALFTEFFPKSKNGLLIGIYNAIYPFSGVLFCIYFILANNWRLLYLITSIIHCYYTYITFKYFIESPRWYHSVGDKEKCLESLTELAIYNGTIDGWNIFQKKNPDLINKIGTPFLEKEITENNSNSEALKKNYNIFQILKFKSQRNIFFKLTIISVNCSYNYYGIILNLGKMKGNFYLNSIFAFLGEFVSELVTGELADKFGRITVFLWCCAIGTLGYLLYLLSPSFKFLFVFIAMIGYSGIFNTVAIYAPEIYPTKIRNITYSYSSFISRLSPICVPILTQAMPNLINLSFLMSGIIAGLIGLTLEETLGKKIMDNIPEEEEENENLRLEFLNH